MAIYPEILQHEFILAVGAHFENQHQCMGSRMTGAESELLGNENVKCRHMVLAFVS